MNILITGYRGFIAKNLIENFKDHHNLTLYEWGEDIPSLSGLDWVIHLGAISSTTETNISKVLSQNLISSIELFEECIARNINFQWASSASVYGDSLLFTESGPLWPKNLYARSKHLLEQYILSRRAPIIYQGFRYFNVYGPNEEHKGKQASPHTQFAKQARETGVIKLFEGSEHFCRDFVPVEYVVNIHKQFLRSKESGVWNVGTGVATSFLSVAEQVAQEYSAKIEIVPFPEHLKSHYQKYTCADTTKLVKTLSTI
jgi:ADP-L-glycero-D-manno-heptose 6-epimerase